MGNLINLAVYNPAILDDNEFMEGFVARHELTERLLSRLREITPKNVARHLLLIGQRGMGKTSMLRRLALGVAKDPTLEAVLIPLTFREEQYNVHNLHVFWCNCLDALGDYLEKIGRHDQATQLDLEVGKLASKGSDPDGVAACALFKEWCTKEGKRPLLLVDNIDLIFSGLKEQHQWGLRRILQERGGVVMVGASAGFLESAAKIEEPFYDFFQVHQLEKLSHQELLTCLRQIALKRGDAGARVIKVLDSDPARIHTLYDLTGGNPRTLVLLYLLLELDSEGDVMDDLERLLDQVTALYKARVEDLAPQTRVVLDAVALAWNPVTMAQVAAETGLETTSISSQFDRLLKMGILEKVSLSTPAPTGYQLGERFFNIWYLMRNASRRMRNRLRWLTEFLQRLYSPQQISDMADDFIRRRNQRGHCSGTFGMALAGAVEDSSMQHALNHMVTKLVQEQAEKYKEMDKADLDQTTMTMDEMKKRVLGCNRDWGSTLAEEFWDLLGGSLNLTVEGKQAITKDLHTLDKTQIESFIEEFRDEIVNNDAIFGLPDALHSLRCALREGVIQSCNDLSHALAAAKAYSAPELPLIMICLTDNDYLLLEAEIAEPLITAIRHLFLTYGERYNSACYFSWGRFLAKNNLPYEAVNSYRKSIELDPKDATSWNNLGHLLQYSLKNHEDAERAYRNAIEVDSKHALPWYNLGKLLQYELNRDDEAEQAYRKAIELNPKDAWFWFAYGNLLNFELRKSDEAEQAYRKAVELDPKKAAFWNNLGYILDSQMNRYDEAEQAYRKAIELSPQEAMHWINLGYLLQAQLGRYKEAEQAYRKAIEINPSDALPWNALGCLLLDHKNDTEAAKSAFHKAIEFGDDTAFPKGNLAYLLLSQSARAEEAEAAYAEAIAVLPEHGKQLLDAFHAMARDNFGKTTECLAKALNDNHPELFTFYQDDLLRLLRLTKARGYGERLITFLQESGLGERHWPLFAAFDAYLHGEERLRDVNPEVRGAARRIFDWLNSNSVAASKNDSTNTTKRKVRKPVRLQ